MGNVIGTFKGNLTVRHLCRIENGQVCPRRTRFNNEGIWKEGDKKLYASQYCEGMCKHLVIEVLEWEEN